MGEPVHRDHDHADAQITLRQTPIICRNNSYLSVGLVIVLQGSAGPRLSVFPRASAFGPFASFQSRTMTQTLFAVVIKESLHHSLMLLRHCPILRVLAPLLSRIPDRSRHAPAPQIRCLLLQLAVSVTVGPDSAGLTTWVVGLPIDGTAGAVAVTAVAGAAENSHWTPLQVVPAPGVQVRLRATFPVAPPIVGPATFDHGLV